MASRLIRSQRVVLPDGVRPAEIRVEDGKIVSITRPWHLRHPRHPGTLIDAGSAVVMPGLVDTHVHINDPGRADWEGFETATLAAAAGGVTTLVDMPLNSIPATTTVAALEAKRRAAAGRCHVDVGFWGGVVPGNAGDIEPLARAGVLGFKCFLSPSGVAEFDHVSEADLREAMPIIAQTGLPLLVHAEMPALLPRTRSTRGPAALCDLAGQPAGDRRTGGDRSADRAVASRHRRACTSCTSPPPTRSRRSAARAPGVCR